MNIQWYPGHMTKTRRMMEENISLVDIVIELLDARLPFSSKNPEIDNLARNKKRIVILNKVDLADEKKTKEWRAYFEDKGFKVIEVNSITGKGIKDITEVSKELMAEKLERLRLGRARPSRDADNTAETAAARVRRHCHRARTEWRASWSSLDRAPKYTAA